MVEHMMLGGCGLKKGGNGKKDITEMMESLERLTNRIKENEHISKGSRDKLKVLVPQIRQVLAKEYIK